MATAFVPLKLEHPDLFGIGLSGCVGRTEKKLLQELVAKCLRNGKTRLVLDLSGLESIGGGGAAVLADFQRQLLEQGGEVVFVGAGSVVRRFLRRQFADLRLRFFASIDEAQAGFDSATEPGKCEDEDGSQRPDEPAPRQAAGWDQHSTPRSDEDPSRQEARDRRTDQRQDLERAGGRDQPEAMGAVCLAMDIESDRDGSLDDMLGAFAVGAEQAEVGGAQRSGDPKPRPQDAGPGPGATTRPPQSASSQPPRAARKPERAAPKRSGTASPVRHQFLSLEEAVAVIKEAPDAAALGQDLSNLLCSHDLASEVIYCVLNQDLLAAPSGEHAFAAQGALAAMMFEMNRPLSLWDIREDELDDQEARLLADIQPDLILPVVWNGTLQATAFLKRGKQEGEYGVSETFALEMLMRVLAEFGGGSPGATSSLEGGTGQGGSPELCEDLSRRLQLSQALLSLSEEFSGMASERQVWERLFKALSLELEVQSLIYMEIDGSTVRQSVSLGESLPPIDPQEFSQRKSRVFLQRQARPVDLAQLPPRLAPLGDDLRRGGIQWVATLKADQLLGYVLLAFRREPAGRPADLDFLSSLLAQVAAALQKLRARGEAGNPHIDLLRLLISLLEQRHYGTDQLTRQVAPLAQELARKVGYPPEQMKDLLYGVYLRDIGMIPLVHLVLHAPQQLSKQQWDQLREHPVAGERLLASLDLPDTVRQIVLSHHERFNGEGYPQGLTGQDIPLEARIVALVENYVTMITDLPNRSALPPAKATAIMTENVGGRFDPDLVVAFMELLQDRRESLEEPEPIQEGVAATGPQTD